MGNIILVGFSGTGKSQVGRVVSNELGWTFVDVDLEIEAREGKSIQRIFAEDGEDVFRRMERLELSRVSQGSRQVISTGGGAMADPDNRNTLLSSGLVVCLDASPESIYRRLEDSHAGSLEQRPMLSGADPLRRIRELKESRRESYSLAHETVDTDGLSVQEAAGKVIELWRLRSQQTEGTAA